MNQPFFTVIVPTYNRAAFLSRCIESVCRQTFTDWELLIIDDGSTDDTQTLVESYKRNENRIQYFYQPNKGVSVARNHALQKATGRYICFLDSDDAYESNHLSFFYRELEKRSFGELFLVTGFTFKDETSEQVILWPKPQPYADKQLEKIMSAYLPYSPTVQSICVPATIKGRVWFDERLRLSECYDFCAKAAAQVKEVVYFPVSTVTLYGHSGNVSILKSIDDCIKFYSRQYDEFRLMSHDPFYRTIVKTKAFKTRLFSLQFGLAKTAIQKRQTGKFVTSFFKAMQHNPTYLLHVNYANLFGKAIRKLRSRSVVPNT